MTGRQKWKFPLSNAPGRFGLILGFVALAAAVPRLLLGSSQFVEYDGYWHVFIAQENNWPSFWHDIQTNAHPPLYFLLLKAILHFGHSLLIYRSISLVTGIASVALVGGIARKVMGSNVRAYQSALAYGLALPGIIVSCEVRSYMLSVFFVLLSFSCFLDIPEPGSLHNKARPRTGFAAWAILACLSHYFAFFYAGAAMALLLGRFARRIDKGEVVNWKTETAAEAATSLPVAAVIYTLYQVHAGRLAQIQSHLLPYYYDPNGHETVTAFLLRNWKNFVNLFSPYQISSGSVAIGVLALTLIGVLASWSRRTSKTILITALMLAGFAVAAIAGKYPFGGDLRQQYLLFPFLVLCGAIVVERMAGKLSAFLPARDRWSLNALVVAAIICVSAVQFEHYPKAGGKVLADRMEVFDRLEPAPEAVYLDQFNLITFFSFYDNWDWTFLKPQPPIPGVDVYLLRRGPMQMLVFRDTTQWNIDPDETTAYRKLAECLRTGKIRGISVFSARQTPPKTPFSDPRLVKRTVEKLASDSALCVQRIAVNQLGWYATFRQSDCAPAGEPKLQTTGTFDDVSDDIQYTGSWSQGPFPAAANGTVSYSNDRGAAARLSFEGTEITYVYSKAFNRGIAEVKLDGISRGDIDLYSPKLEWQSRTSFRDLAHGKHTFEVTVSGRKDAAATDRYVDVDALIVH